MSKPLLVRNSRTLSIWLPIILVSCSFVFYLILDHHAQHAQEKLLELKQYNVWNAFVSSNGQIPSEITGEYSIKEGVTKNSSNTPIDTLLFIKNKGGKLPFQMITKKYDWGEKKYLLTTFVSSTEISHLIIKVFITEAVILLVLLVAIGVLNKISSGKLWRPFFITIHEMENYDIAKKGNVSLDSDTGTTEFDQLNLMVLKLIDKVNAAYHNQKQFVENASHEMQTPLAIIQTKLELLINKEGMSEEIALLVDEIASATTRMSELNRTLLLLSKIENKQFLENEQVEIAEVTKNILNEYLEFDATPQIIKCNLDKKIQVNANRTLIEILISNLIKNAIVHNNEQMKIKLEIAGNTLHIENTGTPLNFPASEIYDRFRKGSHKQKTMGLGLSLVKQICRLYDFSVNYKYDDGWHIFEIKFFQDNEVN